MPTYLGRNVVTMPSSPAPASVKPKRNYIAGKSLNPFTGQEQIQDWQADVSQIEIDLPPMISSDGANWTAFLQSCNGVTCVFQLPTSVTSLLPSGMAPGGYWELAEDYEYSVSPGGIYGFTPLKIREAK